MERITNVVISGIGAVSPAGWGIAPLRDALEKAVPLRAQTVSTPDQSRSFLVRTVPPAGAAAARHARTRRATAITEYALGAAREAVGTDGLTGIAPDRCGVVLAVMSGCVQYTRRFWAEVVREPSSASPILFPETVFNAPASHIAAVLNVTGMNYTLVGDCGAFLHALSIATLWFDSNLVDACVVIGAEEADWITADAYHRFASDTVMSEGAGALFLTRTPSPAARSALRGVTQPFTFADRRQQRAAVRAVRAELAAIRDQAVLCASWQHPDPRGIDATEREVWSDWAGAVIAPKSVLGEGLAASAAWQCAVAADALRQGPYQHALVSVAGLNQQSIGAWFSKL